MLDRIHGFVKCRHAYLVYNFSLHAYNRSLKVFTLHVRTVLHIESSRIRTYNLAAPGGPSRPRDRMREPSRVPVAATMRCQPESTAPCEFYSIKSRLNPGTIQDPETKRLGAVLNGPLIPITRRMGYPSCIVLQLADTSTSVLRCLNGGQTRVSSSTSSLGDSTKPQ